MYDAIIVGARAAGSPTAMLLAARGYRVLVVDRSRFPSDIMSTHMLTLTATARLKRWGLLERIIGEGTPAIDNAMVDFGPLQLSGWPEPFEGNVATYAPRRTVLDNILVEAAVEAGAELREGFSVQSLVWEEGRVAGIRGRGAGGAVAEERAPIVIGADGMRSLVARSVGAEEYKAHPSVTTGYYSYWSGVELGSTVEVHIRPYLGVIAVPTNNDHAMIVGQWPAADFHRIRADIEGNFQEALERAAPGLAEQVARGRREERWVGTADVPNFFRRAYGPGWALVGDAGYHKDPTWGHGIGDAFRHAEYLVEALADAFAGRASIDAALAAYAERRDSSVLPWYDAIIEFATLAPPPPEMVDLLGAMATNQRAINQFLGVIEDVVSPADFFSPENIGRIMAGAEPLAVAA